MSPVGKLLEKITGEIIPSYLSEYNVAVVCSARSGDSKSTGTTNLLLQAMQSTFGTSDNTQTIDETIDTVKAQHLDALTAAHNSTQDLLEGSQAFKVAKEGIAGECEDLRSYLHALKTVGHLPSISKDRIISKGEILACHIMQASLNFKQIDTEIVDFREIVQSAYEDDLEDLIEAYETQGADFFEPIIEQMGRKLLAADGKVAIVPGFFGMLPKSLLQSIGRGYSDCCAAMCAVGVGARELQIWKEVDGVFTADPSKVPSARLLRTVTAEEATELTYYGSEVINPFTVEQIQRSNMTMRLKNVQNPGGTGTTIYPSNSPGASVAASPAKPATPSQDSEKENLTPLSTFMASNGYHGETNSRRRPSAVTIKESVVVVNVLSNRQAKDHSFLAQMFSTLDEYGVSVDLITTSVQSISLAISSVEPQILRRLVKGFGRFGNVTVKSDLTIVSVVGHKMRNMVGIAGEIFNTLAQAKVNVYLIGQGASEINISTVVKAEDALNALQTIHLNVLGIPTNYEMENTFIKGPWLF